MSFGDMFAGSRATMLPPQASEQVVAEEIMREAGKLIGKSAQRVVAGRKKKRVARGREPILPPIPVVMMDGFDGMFGGRVIPHVSVQRERFATASRKCAGLPRDEFDECRRTYLATGRVVRPTGGGKRRAVRFDGTFGGMISTNPTLAAVTAGSLAYLVTSLAVHGSSKETRRAATFAAGAGSVASVVAMKLFG